nr:unnamed protein product [Digitaria exilis]
MTLYSPELDEFDATCYNAKDVTQGIIYARDREERERSPSRIFHPLSLPTASSPASRSRARTLALAARSLCPLRWELPAEARSCGTRTGRGALRAGMDDGDSVVRSVDRAGAAPGDDGSAAPLPETVRISLASFASSRVSRIGRPREARSVYACRHG